MREEQNKAHLAFQLGKDLTKGAISVVGLNHQYSWDLILQQQGVVDQLGLRLILSTLFEPALQNYKTGGSVIILSPFGLIDERLRDFHGERVAAAFNVARRTQWLNFRSGCTKTVEQEERFLAIYKDFEAGMANQELRKLARLFVGRDFTKYELDTNPASVKAVVNQTVILLMSMEFELQERTDPVTGAGLSCPEAGF